MAMTRFEVTAVGEFFRDQDLQFFHKSVNMLELMCNNSFQVQGDYVKKRILFYVRDM